MNTIELTATEFGEFKYLKPVVGAAWSFWNKVGVRVGINFHGDDKNVYRVVRVGPRKFNVHTESRKIKMTEAVKLALEQAAKEDFGEK